MIERAFGPDAQIVAAQRSHRPVDESARARIGNEASARGEVRGDICHRARARGGASHPRGRSTHADEGHRRDHREDAQSAIAPRVVRIVLDPNALVSGLLSAAGPPGWIIEAVLAGDVELAFDAAIRQEYEEVLRRPEFGFHPARVDDILAALDQFAFVVAAAAPWPIALPDADDEPFLAVARASASVLVTGNLRHFPARARGGVSVLTPRGFVESLKPSSS
jgi:putative PIN family toxin of toxin-antitoxin system